MTNIISSIMWLSFCVYFESRGEPEIGQIAVAHVVLNRMEEDNSTVKEIILQPNQFSWTNDDIADAIRNFPAFNHCVYSVIKCLDQRAGGFRLEGANHYYNPNIVNPKWARKMKLVARYGNHIFLRGDRGSGSGLKSYKR